METIKPETVSDLNHSLLQDPTVQILDKTLFFIKQWLGCQNTGMLICQRYEHWDNAATLREA